MEVAEADTVQQRWETAEEALAEAKRNFFERKFFLDFLNFNHIDLAQMLKVFKKDLWSPLNLLLDQMVEQASIMSMEFEEHVSNAVNVFHAFLVKSFKCSWIAEDGFIYPRSDA